MATTIVNPPAKESGNNGMGFLLGIIILVVFGILFYLYAFPYLRQMSNQDIQVNVPATEVNVPSDINVTVDEAEE